MMSCIAETKDVVAAWPDKDGSLREPKEMKNRSKKNRRTNSDDVSQDILRILTM